MRALLRVFELLVTIVDRMLRARQQRKAQEECDELESNPAGWFDGHFGGMRKSSNDADKADP